MGMPAYAARETRQPVKIGARLKSERGWSDVVIGNVSSRGMMGVCDAPPPRGDYIEVRCGTYVIIARVAWAANDRFGARVQDRIELSDLIAAAEGRAIASRERRRLQCRPVDTTPRRPSLVEQAAASARLGRTLDFLSVALAGGALAALAAGAAHDAMAKPLDEVSFALAQARTR